jgi:hypothetical protein
MGRSAGVGSEVSSNDRLALQAISGIDPDLPDAFIMDHGRFLIPKLPVTGI